MGLTSRTIVRRLRAWHLGEPLTRGKTIHTATADPKDRLLLAFVRMGGESRPWAVTWQEGRKRPQYRFVAEPRFRAGIDSALAELGPILAAHLRHPALTRKEPTGTGDLAPLRQIWVPNSSHVDMLHHLAYAYARRAADREHAEELRLLGRAALFAFLEAQRPGQQLVMSAGDVLRSAYDFPAEDIRQAHLGFLLAWLEHRGDRDRGLAAALEAEKQPVATALLPAFEREELSPRVEEHNEARRAGNTKAMRQAERAIGELLRPELERRLALVEKAIDLIVDDPRPVNGGVSTLVNETLESQWWHYVHPEQGAIARGGERFLPSAETDFAARGAAERYFRHDASADRMFAALVHDDIELEAEAISSGRAFRGTVTKVWDEGSGRKKIPVQRIEDPTPGPLSLRVGDRVCFVGHAKRAALIREIATTKGGGLALTIEIQNRKNEAREMPWPHSMHASDERWVGRAVTIIGSSFANMTDTKARRVAGRDPLPGDWIIPGREAERDVADEDGRSDEAAVPA